jgi:two-component system sensor histidine kinase DesK
MTTLAIPGRHWGRVVHGTDAAAEGAAAGYRASTIVVAVLGLILAAKVAEVGTAGWGQAPFVAASFVLPFLYVVPATQPLWTNRRWWLLGIQAVLTYVPFAVFGSSWTVGVSGLLGGLVLLTVAGPYSWLLFCALLAAESVIRIGVVGLPVDDGAWSFVFVLVTDVDVGLALFGLARLADLVAKVHAARGELADLAINRERLRAAETMRSAIGERLTAVSDRAETALQVLDHSQAQARELVAEAGALTRQALARVRGRAAYLYPAQPEAAVAPRTGAALAPRLALTVLVIELCGFAAQTLNNVAAAHLGPAVTAAAVADGLAIIALQLHHSRPPRHRGQPPAAWPWTLALQVLLVYGMAPALGWIACGFCGFIAGSALLLIPGPWGRAAFAAIVVSTAALIVAWPPHGLTRGQEISVVVYYLTATAGIGLLVYGLSRLAGLAVRLEELRGELARAATLQERMRVARDTHDLLGLGMTAVALKADLITRLIGRDDARARTEIEEMRRACASAIADMPLVTGEGGQLSLAGELAQARAVLLSGGVGLRADLTGEPMPASADAVLATVLREAITNILRHSTATQCTITTAVADGLLRLHVSNDGAGKQAEPSPGQGLANLTARIHAIGGHLTSRHDGDRFDLIAEIPYPGLQPPGVGGDAHRVDPVARAELGHRGGQVIADGAVGQEKLGGDLGGSGAGRAQPEHLDLPRRQRITVLLERGRRQLGIEHPLARGHPPHRGDQLIGGRVLDQEPRYVRGQGPAQVGRPAEHRQDQHPALGQQLVQPFRGRQPVHPRHIDIQHRDVGAALDRRGHDTRSGRHLGDDLDVGLQAQHRHQGLAQDPHVLRDQDPDHSPKA